MCKYCENYNKKMPELSLGDIIIVDNAKYTLVGDGNEYSIPLNHCPNCGRELVTMDDLCKPEIIKDISIRLKKYDTTKPKMDELKFIKEIADKYCVEPKRVVKTIQYLRRHNYEI